MLNLPQAVAVEAQRAALALPVGVDVPARVRGVGEAEAALPARRSAEDGPVQPPRPAAPIQLRDDGATAKPPSPPPTPPPPPPPHPEPRPPTPRPHKSVQLVTNMVRDEKAAMSQSAAQLNRFGPSKIHMRRAITLVWQANGSLFESNPTQRRASAGSLAF